MESEGKYTEALEYLQRLEEKLTPADGSIDPDVYLVWGRMADICKLQGNFEKAILLYKRGLALTLRTKGPFTVFVTCLGEAYRAQGDYTNALPYYERTLAINEWLTGPGSRSVAQSLVELGSVQLDAGNFREALSSLERSLVIREKVFGPEHPDVADSLDYLARLHGVASASVRNLAPGSR